MFQNVIVRRPCKALIDGITSNPQLGKPDYEKACKQHDTYIAALKQCGVAVTVLEADERYPDSCFVEDPAVITRKCAIITNPGAYRNELITDEIVNAYGDYTEAMAKADEWRANALNNLDASSADYEKYKAQINQVYDDMLKKADETAAEVKEEVKEAAEE